MTVVNFEQFNHKIVTGTIQDTDWPYNYDSGRACFFIEGQVAHHEPDRARIVLDRREALAMRRQLTVYLRETAPKRKVRK